MASLSYLPTYQDILRSSAKTTGIVETEFKVGEVTYRLISVTRGASVGNGFIALRILHGLCSWRIYD